jgi:hypothetical protein
MQRPIISRIISDKLIAECVEGGTEETQKSLSISGHLADFNWGSTEFEEAMFSYKLGIILGRNIS